MNLLAIDHSHTHHLIGPVIALGSNSKCDPCLICHILVSNYIVILHVKLHLLFHLKQVGFQLELDPQCSTFLCVHVVIPKSSTALY